MPRLRPRNYVQIKQCLFYKFNYFHWEQIRAENIFYKLIFKTIYQTSIWGSAGSVLVPPVQNTLLKNTLKKWLNLLVFGKNIFCKELFFVISCVYFSNLPVSFQISIINLLAQNNTISQSTLYIIFTSYTLNSWVST